MIGSKGRWELSDILKSKVFPDWSIINIRKANHIYLLYINIFAGIFGKKTTSHCFLLIKFTGVAQKWNLHLDVFFQ